MAILKSLYDVAKMSFIKGFDGKGVRVILGKGQSACVATFAGEYNGNTYYHIRELRENYGDWAPGKGISVRAEDRMPMLRELTHEYVVSCTPEELIELGEFIAHVRD